MTKSFKAIALAAALITVSASSALAEDLGERLFRMFLDELNPQRAQMVLREPPEESGLIKHVYMDMEGADIGGVRIDRITVEGMDVAFTSPETWGTESADVTSILATNAVAVIKEEDINSHLKSKEFGDDEKWNNLALDFSPGRVYAKGYYLADLVLLKLNILIEIDGTFKVKEGKQVWLDDYTLKVNRAKVPEGLTDRAMAKIQPILDLGKFMFPLKLSGIELDEDKAVVKSVSEPRPFEGIVYEYDAETVSRDL